MLLGRFLGIVALFAVLSLFPPKIVQAASFSIQPSSTCMKVADGGRQANGQTVIRFYNGCPQDAYINVCIKDDMGDVKLYKSGNIIRTNGFFTVYSYPNSYPRVVQWTSDASNPAVPTLCAKSGSTSQTFNPRYVILKPHIGKDFRLVG